MWLNLNVVLLESIWILVHFIGQMIPFLFYAYYAIYALDTFIPIQGRSGPTTNPETFIAIITTFTGILLTGHLIPTLCVFRRPVLWMCGFVVVFFVFIILMATPLGFPYRDGISQQRFWIFVREIFNIWNGLQGFEDDIFHWKILLSFGDLNCLGGTVITHPSGRCKGLTLE